jgi:sugar lactone lactonase YvrE
VNAPLRALLLAAAAVGMLSIAGTPRMPLPDFPNVTTLAGTGIAGIADGPPSQAQFEGPQGIAYDKHGNLIVADTPAQRIRMVDSHGNVTTLAGSGEPVLFGSAVSGGYRDGPADSAQFNGPAGVAVGADGAVYVADFVNHCIRKIIAGSVSTYAGSPARPGHTDGAPNVASFTNPRGIAAAADGSLYVTDFPSGVRRIARDGSVSTLRENWMPQATSLAFYHDRNVDELAVGTPDYIGLIDLKKGDGQPFVGYFTSNGDESWRRVGQSFDGPPSAVAPLGPNELVYADALFSTVRLAQIDRTVPWNSTRTLGAEPSSSNPKNGGGYRDGAGTDALYDRPTGVAVSPDGTIAVADTGNRRIRMLSAFDRRSFSTEHIPLPTAPDATTFRVVLVGNSIVWSDVPWQRSFAGAVERTLCARRRSAPGRCRVTAYPLMTGGGTAAGMASYVKEYLSDGLVDVVVFMVPAPQGLGADENVAGYGSLLGPMLRGVVAGVKTSHTGLLVVLIPSGFQIPNAFAVSKFSGALRPIDPGLEQAQYDAALAAVKRSGANYLDLWPRIFAHENLAGSKPLYRAMDNHLNDAGNEFAGDAIARAIVAAHLEGVR